MKCLSKGQLLGQKPQSFSPTGTLPITSVFVSGKQSKQLCLHTGQTRENDWSSSVKRHPHNARNLQCAAFFLLWEIFQNQVFLNLSLTISTWDNWALSTFQQWNEKHKTTNSSHCLLCKNFVYGAKLSKCCFPILSWIKHHLQDSN